MVNPTRMFPLLALIVGVVLSVLPTEGQAQVISGKGTGIDPGNAKDTAGVTVTGRHSGNIFPGPGSTCAPMATVFAAVNTDPFGPPFGGSDVFPFNGGGMVTLPLVDQVPGSSCIYEDAPPLPRINLTLGANSTTSFYFTLIYRQGKYENAMGIPTCPTSPPRPVKVMLTTAFAVVGAGIVFSDTVEWLSYTGAANKPCENLKFPAP